MNKSVMVMLPLLALLLGSCETFKTPNPQVEEQKMFITRNDYEPVGVVTTLFIENWILGFSPEISLVSAGGRSPIRELMEAAKKLDADDVINITVETKVVVNFLFNGYRQSYAKGIAIKYKSENFRRERNGSTESISK